MAACTPLGDRGLTGVCPDGETCSPETPDGLEFVGTPVDSELVPGLFLAPEPTLVGGTQDIHLQWDPDHSGVFEPFPLSFVAEIDNGSGGELSVVGTSGSTVTVAGTLAGGSYLRVLDPATNELFDRYFLLDEKLEKTAFAPPAFETLLPDTPIAYGVGSATLVVELSGSDAIPDVDTSMTLTTPGATQASWDTLAVANADIGPVSIAVTAAGAPQPPLTYTVVAGADTIVVNGDAPALTVGQDTEVCFAALASGAQILNLHDWGFASPDLDVGLTLVPNCVSVSSTTVQTGHLLVGAGGAQLDLPIPVSAANAVHGSAQPRRSTPWRTPDGERAVSSHR